MNSLTMDLALYVEIFLLLLPLSLRKMKDHAQNWLEITTTLGKQHDMTCETFHAESNAILECVLRARHTIFNHSSPTPPKDTYFIVPISTPCPIKI